MTNSPKLPTCLQRNNSDRHSNHHILQNTNPTPSDKHGSLGPGGQAAAGDEVADGWPSLKLRNKVVLGCEEVAEVAEEVVEDISFVALANGVQVNC